MKKIGILGGLGPHTTSVFYTELIDLFLERNPNQRPAIEIYSIPLDLGVEQNFIQGKALEEYYEYLRNGLLELVKSQPDFIVIPCNSVHIYLSRLKELTNIPILSILEVTANRCARLGYKKVGILGTDLTISENLYGNSLKENGIEQIIPNTEQQAVILNIVSKILLHGVEEGMKEDLYMVLNEMKGSVDCFVLACTDLQLILNENSEEFKIIDSLKSLEIKTVEVAME